MAAFTTCSTSSGAERSGVVRAVAATTRGGRRRRRLVLAVAIGAVLLVPAAGALAFPSARHDVLEWLGVEGATVTRATELPPALELRVEELGAVVSLAEA